jgi:hypothetical protein
VKGDTVCAISASFTSTPPSWPSFSDAEDRELTRECAVYDDELRRSGHLIACDALARPETAMIVRLRNHKVSVTDGPYVETKEYLGFLYIEARDLNEAIELASKCSAAAMNASCTASSASSKLPRRRTSVARMRRDSWR